MIIDYNSRGRWSADEVRQRYRDLRARLGGASGFELDPRTYTNPRGITWVYNIMASVPDGVRLGDRACIELAVQYLEADLMDSGTGYIRERIARVLRHADMDQATRHRLARLFLSQLWQGKLHKEFREYIRLFRVIGIEDYRDEIERLSRSRLGYVQRAAHRLLGR